MKRLISLAAVLVLMLCLLSGCSATVPAANPVSVATLVPDTNPVLPQVQDTDTLHARDSATLYFRYGTEPYLAPESRTIAQTASQSYELALITQLLAGPSTQNTQLRSLFPDGTRVISTNMQGRTLFVTLSEEIMNGYADEPATWAEDASWAIEAPLRRQLCMQSLVATVTENCEVDQVQVIVQQSDTTVSSLRLKQSYFLTVTEDDSMVVGPMVRQSNLLLGPDTTMEVILTCWQNQDWQRLLLYMTQETTLSALTEAMENVRPVVTWQHSPVSITDRGLMATYSVDFTLLGTDNQLTQRLSRILRLQRENGLWKISLRQLTGWLEEGL